MKSLLGSRCCNIDHNNHFRRLKLCYARRNWIDLCLLWASCENVREGNVANENYLGILKVLEQGAYTGVCSTQHVPSYKNSIEKFKVKGVDSIICVAVNDPYVLNGWAEKLQAKEADAVMLGADQYETDAEKASLLAKGRVPIGIGENTQIRDFIIDKNARIGKNVVIANSEGIQEADRSSEGFYIRSGITIILKNSTIKDGFII